MFCIQFSLSLEPRFILSVYNYLCQGNFGSYFPKYNFLWIGNGCLYCPLYGYLNPGNWWSILLSK